uniref:Uncharacterized protein n=1 Tax=Glossina austeni TaxID=7395 RepID=A0A1A9VSW4_GLOAU
MTAATTTTTITTITITTIRKTTLMMVEWNDDFNNAVSRQEWHRLYECYCPCKKPKDPQTELDNLAHAISRRAANKRQPRFLVLFIFNRMQLVLSELTRVMSILLWHLQQLKSLNPFTTTNGSTMIIKN